jgi:nicotinate-nucleotide--dimethylbenzimidazole phosphoribosyltransferase
MTEEQCLAAITLGREVVQGLPGNAVLLGEMGIGNTSSAAMLLARLSGTELALCVGRGTGLDDAGLARKLGVLSAVMQKHSMVNEPLQALAALGGFEIAALVGAVLQAASQRRTVVVDGFITGAAVMVAARLVPAVLGYCVWSHRSAESGHGVMIRHLGVQPLLDLDLRLGEGSGAALTWPLLASAVLVLNEMASFESAGVSDRGAQ